ncbi:DUF4179 domain-containing protein [Halobacillus sp. H74]|uniref:DUF4179 domain-containing protein n=1 Tax=Halobacillus sp. H74 TaxID=3457436 RepID=UPI003FCD2A15
MGDMFKEAKGYYENHYYDDYIHDRIKKSVNEEIQKDSRKNTKVYNRKGYYLATVAALFIAVLIGTSFMSPSVSNVMSKLPIIGSMFNAEEEKLQISEKVNKDQEMLNEEKQIKEKLREIGHSIGLAFYLPNEDIFTVGIITEKENFQKLHEKIKKQVSSLVHSYGRENYDIEVFRYVEGTHIEKASYDRWGELTGPFAVGRKQEILTSYLEEETGTNEHLNTAFDFGSNVLTVYADTTETDVEALKAALPKKLETINFGTFKVEVRVLGES